MSTSIVLLLFSHAALASSIFVSLGRMSYLSKSKWTSFSSVVVRKVPGCGRAVDDTARLTALLPLGLLVLLTLPPPGALPVPLLKLAAPPGAGADAIDVAGRFAQPAAISNRSIAGATMNRVVIAFLRLQFVLSVALDRPVPVPASIADGLAPAPGPRCPARPLNSPLPSASPLPPPS